LRISNLGGKSRIYFANALRTTRSTFARLAKGGSAPKAFRDDAKTNRRMRKIFCAFAREALLDIKFRRQSRIGFTNALRTTRSTFARLAKGIGFSRRRRSAVARRRPKTM